MQEELDEARRMSFVNGRWVDQQVGKRLSYIPLCAYNQAFAL